MEKNLSLYYDRLSSLEDGLFCNAAPAIRDMLALLAKLLEKYLVFYMLV